MTAQQPEIISIPQKTHPQKCDELCISFERRKDDAQKDYLYCKKAQCIIHYSWRMMSAFNGCASRSSSRPAPDDVLDIGEILDNLCNIELTQFTFGDREGEDVGKCRGKECNYCGRYNEQLRSSQHQER